MIGVGRVDKKISLAPQIEKLLLHPCFYLDHINLVCSVPFLAIDKVVAMVAEYCVLARREVLGTSL